MPDLRQLREFAPEEETPEEDVILSFRGYILGAICQSCGGPVPSDPEHHQKTDGGYICGECLSILDAGDDPNEEVDEDPQCVCGVFKSEHAVMGCPEGFQTPKQWEEERQGIRDAIWSQDDGDDDWYGGFDPYE